jgi:peptidoglycan/xylan/chitin deacetylase (PgdA/CDA1 family)
MKPSPTAAIATLAAAAVLLASAAIADPPSAAVSRNAQLTTGPLRPSPIETVTNPVGRLPVASPEPILDLNLLPLETPPTAPILWPTLLVLPVPGQPVAVPVLYMHQIVDIPADISTWSVTAQEAFLRQSVSSCAFAQQMDWLAAHGYHTVLPRDLAAFWDRGIPLPVNSIILTFDDGSPDWYSTILPILRAHAFVAEFYVTLDHVGTSLNWDQLREMVAAGMGIGAHDVNHVQLTGGRVVPAAPEVMRSQVTEVKRVLESQLAVSVDSMAYVGGGYDGTLMDIVHAAGYSTARAINRGIWQESGARYRLRVSRINVWDDVVGGTMDNAINCVLDPALGTFESRVTGANPG